MKRLEGKVAIITGAGQGVGRGIALAMAKEGASVVLAGRTESKVRQVAEEIRSLGLNALPITCDAGDCEKDIGPVAVFLASDDSHYLTGHTFTTDGGRFMLV